jgi:predicted ATPase
VFRSVRAGLQAVLPRIEDVNYDRIQPGRLILRFKERGISDPLGPSNVSDGVLHALALLIEIEGSGKSGGTLAIEEPENAIHPWSLRTIAQRAQQSPSGQRLLFTTHSETMVNAVSDPAALFVVENDLQRGTRVVPANKKEKALDAILRETEQKLGDVWLDGTIGGVPEGDR